MRLFKLKEGAEKLPRVHWIEDKYEEVPVDIEAAYQQAHADIARLTWGREGQDALETIEICLKGIIRDSVRAALGNLEGVALMQSTWPLVVGEGSVALDADAEDE